MTILVGYTASNESKAALAAALYSVARKAPGTFTGSADHLVSESVYLDDPEGNGIEVYADRAPETWKWDGGSVAMATDQLDIDLHERHPPQGGHDVDGQRGRRRHEQWGRRWQRPPENS